MILLECPNCHVGLEKAPQMGGVFYVCPSCGGRSAGLMLLRKLGLKWEFYDKLYKAGKKIAEPFAKLCPHCSRKMKNCDINTPAGIVELDVCPICQQVWFDPSEFRQFKFKEQSVPRPEPLPRDALQTIALAKVRRMENATRFDSREYVSGGDDWTSDSQEPNSVIKSVAGYMGFPVELDEEPLRLRPYMTWLFSFLFLLLAILIYETSDENKAIMDYGFITNEWYRMGGLTIISSFFLHGGIYHLGSNLYFFLTFSDNVEDRLGHLKFLALLFSSHIFGLLLFALFDEHKSIPTIGASGGIAGVMAYYSIMFPASKIGLCIKRIWITLPACIAFVIFVILQLIGVSEQYSGYTDVNYLAHFGGVIVGVLVALATLLRKKDAATASFHESSAAPEGNALSVSEETDKTSSCGTKDYNPDDYKK